MNVYMTEEEQLEAIKSFFKQYGTTILVAMLITLVLFLGWRYWNQRNESLGQVASVNYEQMLQSLMNGDEQATSLQAKNIITQYSHTPYASLASFVLAKLAVKNNQFDEAIKNLQWVIEHNNTSAMRQIATLRAARILIMQDHAADALHLLNKVYDANFVAAVEEVKGDAYLTLKENKKAHEAYQNVLAKMPDAAHRALVEMKLAGVN